jgi:F0F1-type ATP synthase membrane subunit b/b'
MEQEAWRTVEAMYEERAAELIKELNESKKALLERDNVLADMARQIDELKTQLGN